MPGLAAVQIVSDELSRHFVCGCCQFLIGPDNGKSCDTCGAVTCGNTATACSACGGNVLPLNKLAINVLNDIQVACVECNWNGSYGQYWDHMRKQHPPPGKQDMWNELEQLDITDGGGSTNNEEEDDEDLRNYNEWNTSINSNMGFWSDDSGDDHTSEDGSDSDDCAKELERIESELAARSSTKSRPKKDSAGQHVDADDKSIDPFGDSPTATSNSRRSRKDSRRKESQTKGRSSKESRSSDSQDRRSRNSAKPGSRSRLKNTSEASEGMSEREKLIRQAERYKKQANAKFNKGEFSSSRGLYSKGIRTMDQITDMTEQDNELLANMLSNRAVTYFREKSFNRTIDDCEAAIRLQPKTDKAYIRKWRALMAKGEFEDAYNFVKGVATQTLPESEKLQNEYRRCHSEMEALNAVKAFMNRGDIVNAQATLDDILKTKDCDNIVLFVYSARLKITVGDFKPALEKINKALRFNPDFVDALECRGFLYFFSGNMEKASNFLYDAYARHKDCENLKSALDRVQLTYRLVQSAEKAAATGNLTESIELYSKAIQSSQPIPPLALLSAQLHIARAKQHKAQHQYTAALQDCQTILQFRPKYGPAWASRAKIMCCLGKPEHAYRELQQQTASWAKDDPDVHVALKEVEFELRVIRENQNIASFCEEMCHGDARRLSRYPSLQGTNRLSNRDLTSRSNTLSNSSLSNNNNNNNNSGHKMKPLDGATTIVSGKSRDSLKSGTTRGVLKKSASTMNGFDLRNLTDVNETLRDEQPNNDRKRSNKRRQASVRDFDRREGNTRSGSQRQLKSNGRKSKSASQLKL